MNGLFLLIRWFIAVVCSTLKNLPGEIGDTPHVPISNTTTVFFSPGCRTPSATEL